MPGASEPRSGRTRETPVIRKISSVLLLMRPLVLPTDTLGRDGDASVAGAVTELREDSFLLSAGPAEFEVDTSSMFYNPYDGIGVQKLEVGDRVLVTGALGRGFPETSLIHAGGVTDIYVVGAAG